MIDLDVLLTELRFGIALLAQCGGQCEATGDDVGRHHRVAGFDPKRLAEFRSLRPGPVEAGQIDRCKPILGAGLNR